MKVDKDALLKHKFWVALGVTVPLTLVALFVLLTAVSADIANRRKLLKDQHDQFKSISNPATPAIIAEERDKAAIEKGRETDVHSVAYLAQSNGLFRWPDAIEREFDFQNGLFAYDIKAVRKNVPDPEPAEPPKNEDRQVHGIVTEVQKDFFLAKGFDKKDYKFRRIPRPKIDISGDKTAPNAAFEELEKDDRVTVLFDIGKYFNDPLTDSEQGIYASPGPPNVYQSPIAEIIEQVEPMNPKGEGVMQFKGGYYYEKGKLPHTKTSFLNFLPGNGWQHIDLDISQETWIAQEDLWIQKEIYRLVRLANDYVSRFEAKPGGKGPEDKTAFHTFSNPYLELKLQWPGGNVLNVQMKNLQNRRQKLDLNLRIRFHKNEKLPPEIVPIGGEPLNPAGTEGSQITKQIKLSDNALRTGIYAVEQALTWETAAVKRMDQICIGTMGDISHSHRTYPLGTQPLVKEPEAADVKAPGAPGAPPGAPPGGAPMMQPKGFDGPPGGFGGGMPGMGMGMGQGNMLTKHGFVKDRYLEVTPQARRLPVAVSLIVEQEHVDRVQTAFNNSVLRFLTTQVLVNRYPSSMRPHLVGQGGGFGFFEGGAGEAGARPGMMPPGLMPPGFPGGGDPPVFGGLQPGGLPGGLPGGFPNPFGGSSAADDMETNVEMVIYGIVTLYERYPLSNRPKDTKAP